MTELNIVDLIRIMMRQLRLGASLQELDKEELKPYSESEVSTAYSWILNRFPELKQKNAILSQQPVPHRLLHFAEKMVLGKKEHGFLLELVSLGIIDVVSMEHIIEKIMLGKAEGIDIDTLKKMVAKSILKGDYVSHFINYKSGTPRIH